MYKIMLGDDEGIVIDSLKYIIEKEFGSTCEVTYAKTGRRIIELAEEYRPDIAIMDIQMPGIDGIGAMKEIRENNNNIVFIVMSAYDKFDYAKEAIRLGVLEYITKPMEKTRIIAAIRKAMRLIDEKREKRSKDLLIKERLETVVPIIENGLIYNMLLQEHFTEDIDQYITLLGIRESHAYMIAVVCGDEQDGNHMTNAVGSSVRIRQYEREVREALKEEFPQAIVGSAMANKIVVMVPSEKISHSYNERVELIERARGLVRKLRKNSNASYRAGIGSIRELREIRISYKEALDALVRTTGSVAHADDLPMHCEYEEDYPIHIERRMFQYIENGSMSAAMSSAEEFFEWMIGNNARDMMNIRLKVLEFVLWAEHIAYDTGGMIYEFNHRAGYLPSVMNMEDSQMLKKWFVQKIGEACQNIINSHSERSTSQIGIAKEYIQENYSKDISLDDVSKKLNISPYYFSKIFKENTGEGFVEYVTKIRIEKAKELLTTTEYSMKEICAMVGYADPNYFSRSFKKNVGITPTEYKQEGITG